jgi:hypothetical protein
MKKILSVLISLFILATALCASVNAESTVTNTYTFETEEAHYTVEFSDNTLTEEQQITIAEKLIADEDNSIQTYGLGCILFGHDYKYTTASVIEHKVRTSAPRCKRKTYDVKYCEDCDFTEETLLTTSYIDCCD